MDSRSTGESSVTFTVVICTYKRVHLLIQLLSDLSLQSVQPDSIIIVDGDPESGEVPSAISTTTFFHKWRILYLPSNHSNLSYQRYLGWLAARQEKTDVLLYLDDDLRISQQDAIEKVLAPFRLPEYKDVVGVTVPSITREKTASDSNEGVYGKRNGVPAFLIKYLGAGRNVRPGGYTASGHRLFPKNNGSPYQEIEWLSGRIMAFRMSAISKASFSDALFATYELRIGKAEDTFLSRRVGFNRRLLMAFEASVEHPDADISRAYPNEAQQRAYAIAYSRRLLNDDFRPFSKPHLSDRIALVKSYMGNIVLNWFSALLSRKKDSFAYAWGYTLGAIRGLIQKPTAHTLTPHIDWWADAEAALSNLQVIKQGIEG